jgi:NPCBM/NEW2 domain
MPRGRTLFWTIIGSVVAAVAVVIALIEVNPGPPPKAASSPVPHISASANSQAGKSAPVVIPRTSRTSSFSYISDLTPSSNLGELIYPGPVKIYGSIYPKSISFFCDDGDLPAFPAVYRLKHNASRFEATVGIEAKWPAHYVVGVSLVGDGRTLQNFSVSVLKPKTVDVNVTGVHSLTLECFSPGTTSSAGGWNVEVAWGNARVTEGH